MVTIYNKTQIAALAIAPRITDVLFFLGLSYIAISIIMDREKQLYIFQRIILGLSCYDMLGLLCFVVTISKKQ